MARKSLIDKLFVRSICRMPRILGVFRHHDKDTYHVFGLKEPQPPACSSAPLSLVIGGGQRRAAGGHSTLVPLDTLLQRKRAAFRQPF